jgi:hypothetical protein
MDSGGMSRSSKAKGGDVVVAVKWLRRNAMESRLLPGFGTDRRGGEEVSEIGEGKRDEGREKIIVGRRREQRSCH